jgi:hypothetical protein
MQRLDHAAILGLIVGTYIILLRGLEHRLTLAFVWTVADASLVRPARRRRLPVAEQHIWLYLWNNLAASFRPDSVNSSSCVAPCRDARSCMN